MVQIVGNRYVLHWINTLQLRLADSGYAHAGPEWHREEACSSFSRIYYVHKGCGWIEQDGKHMLLREEHMYLIPAGYRYAYGCDEQFDHLFFHINIAPSGTEDLVSQLHRVIELPMKRSDIERMVTLYRSPDTNDALTVSQRLYRDVVAFIRHGGIHNEPAPSYSVMVQNALELIRERLSAKLTVARLSQALSVPASTLAKRFRREVGIPLGAYMDSLLFQKAQQLLLFTDLSIGEIADLLEFCDPFYFSRYFKLHQKETPSRYRKRITGDDAEEM